MLETGWQLSENKQMIKFGKYIIEWFKPEVGVGHPLWDAGYRVRLKKILGIKFLLWSLK